MAVYSIGLPDGRTIDIEAADEATAVRGAKEWHAANPKATETDPYRDTARQEFDALKAKGAPTGGSSLQRKLLQGITMNSADEILAGMATPIEMIKRGTFNPAEGYRYAKAAQDIQLEDATKDTGAIGTAAEIAGGMGSGLGLARAGATFGRLLAPNAGLGARSLASAADAGGMGLLAGGMEGNTLSERGTNAAVGGLLGGAIGGAAPAALALGGAALSPITSNIRARVNPEGFAQSQVARGITESGRTPRQIADEVMMAGREGQPMFTAADAMGNSGQRMLSSTARAPGRARTDVVEFLDSRQAGQGRRIANQLAEGFDAPQTAAQTRTGLTTARDAAADAEYGAVRGGAGRVDVVPAINNIDRTIGTGPGQVLQAPNDSIEGVLRPFRERLARVNPDDFEAIQRIRSDMADLAQNSRQQGYGNRARLIGNAVRALDESMENASGGFRQANQNFAQASRNIDAIDEGVTAATRGRSEDIVPRFRGLTNEGQDAYRSGYVDPLIQQVQSGAFGVNKARPFSSDAFATESAAIAPMARQPTMMRQLGRENTMFQTRNAAVGNSKTAENLADDASMGIDPTLVGQILGGNWSGVLRSALSSGSNLLSGNTPEVRQRVAQILLQRGQNMNPASFQRLLDETMRRIETVRIVASQLGRGASAGLAVTPAATQARN